MPRALLPLLCLPLFASAQPVAISSDGRYVAAAANDPPALLILDAGLAETKRLPSPSPISFLQDAPRRKSFIVALKDAPELWEVSYDPNAEPIADGLVHDFRLREGNFLPGFLNPRRTKLEQPLERPFLVQELSQMVGMQRGTHRAVVVQLDVRRVIATFEMRGRPDFSASVERMRYGRRVLLVPDSRGGFVTLIDVADWKVVVSSHLQDPVD